MKKPTSGDVLRVYVTPPSSTFPWVQLFHHPHGIREPGVEVGGVDAVHDRAVLARMIGEAIIDNSRILTEWTTPATNHPAGEDAPTGR